LPDTQSKYTSEYSHAETKIGKKFAHLTSNVRDSIDLVKIHSEQSMSKPRPDKKLMHQHLERIRQAFERFKQTHEAIVQLQIIQNEETEVEKLKREIAEKDALIARLMANNKNQL
jgi:hypothetical protein